MRLSLSLSLCLPIGQSTVVDLVVVMLLVRLTLCTHKVYRNLHNFFDTRPLSVCVYTHRINSVNYGSSWLSVVNIILTNASLGGTSCYGSCFKCTCSHVHSLGRHAKGHTEYVCAS